MDFPKPPPGFEPVDEMPPPPPGFTAVTQATPTTPAIARPSGLVRRVVGDTAVDLGKGILGVGEAVVGAGNIVSGGYVGKGLEAIGYDPATSKKMLEEGYTPERVAANKEVSDAKGFLPTIAAAVKNPSTIAGAVVESAPLMLGGGAVSQGLKRVIASPVIRGAIGEGLVGAGMSAEQTRQQSDTGLLDAQGTIAAIGSGVGTAALGAVGGGLARKLGIADVDTALAGGGLAGPKKNILRRAAEGMIAEGAFEELPQSAQEQMWSNYATGKPIMDGVAEAAAMGAVTGGVMGGGFNAVAGNPKEPPAPTGQPDPTTQANPAAEPSAVQAAPVADPATTVAQPATPDPFDGAAMNAELDAAMGQDRAQPQFDQEAITRYEDQQKATIRSRGIMDGTIPPPQKQAADNLRAEAQVMDAQAQTGIGKAAAMATAMQADTIENEKPLDRLARIATAAGFDPAQVLKANEAYDPNGESFADLPDEVLSGYAKTLLEDASRERSAPEQRDVGSVGLRGNDVPAARDGQASAGTLPVQVDGGAASLGEQAAVQGEAGGSQAQGVTPQQIELPRDTAPTAEFPYGRGERAGSLYNQLARPNGAERGVRDTGWETDPLREQMQAELDAGKHGGARNGFGADPSGMESFEARYEELLRERYAAQVNSEAAAGAQGLTPARAPLSVRMGGNEYPVESYEDASAKFRQLRDTVDIGGMPAVELIDQGGNPVGYIGQGGEVYEGSFQEARLTPERKAPVYRPPAGEALPDPNVIEGEASRVTAGQAPQAQAEGSPQAPTVAERAPAQSPRQQAPQDAAGNTPLPANPTATSSASTPQIETSVSQESQEVPSPQGTPVEGGGQPNNWLGADQAFVKDAPQYGAPTGDSGATAAVQAAPAGTTVLDTVRRPDGSEFNRLLVSAGDGDYDTVIIRDRNKPLADYVSEAKRDANERAPGRAWAKADRDGMPDDLAAIKAAVAEAGGANTALNDTSKSNSAIAAEVAKKLGIPNDKALESNVYEARQRVIKESEAKADAEARATFKVGDKVGRFEIPVDGKRRAFSSATIEENDGGWIKLTATMVGGKKGGVTMTVRPAALRRQLDAHAKNNPPKPKPRSQMTSKELKAQEAGKASATNKPLAVEGLTSYRYQGRYGPVMIGAKDSADALKQAERSISGTATPDKLEVWNGTDYVADKPQAEQTASKYAKYDEAAKAYGRSVRDDGAILKGGKESGLFVREKGKRLRIEDKDGRLTYSGAPNGDALGKFMESFWFAEKQAAPLESTETLSDTDLTPAERASFNRQREYGFKGSDGVGITDNERSALEVLEREESRANGIEDADKLGLRTAVNRVIGGVFGLPPIQAYYLRGKAGLNGIATPRYMQLLADQQKGRSGKMRTAGLYLRAEDTISGTPVFVLFTDVAREPWMAAFTAAHEVAGHHGLRSLLGPRMRAVLRAAYQNPTVKKVADSMYESREFAERIAKGTLTPENARYLAIEEALADLAAAVRTENFQRIKDKHGVEVPKVMQSRVRSMLDTIVQRIKELFRRKDVRFSDGQVSELLENAWSAAQRTDPTIAGANGALESVDNAGMDELPARARTKEQMIERGADGHLSRAYERYIPIDKLDGLEPVPANNESDDGKYHSGRAITLPIEVQYDAGTDSYMVYGGNHRIAQAKANGQTHILAFVEPDISAGRDFIGTYPQRTNPDAAIGTPSSALESTEDQTQSEAFKKWFKDSKVVDADGSPLVVYHGTDANIEAFDAERSKDGGVWFTPVAGAAEMYSGSREGANIIPAYVSLQNPYEAKVGESRQDALDKAMDRGHDGLIVRDSDGSISTLAAFKPTQIKSSIGNNGNFNPDNPSILESVEAVESVGDALAGAMNSVRDVKLPAGYMLSDLFGKSQGASLNWWHKSVGTMFNLAQREPLFKRVFDSVQNMVADISHYANAAMDLAPDVLPKFDTIKDALKKQPMSAKDAKVVSSAVFDGTLKWARDQTGNVVQATEMNSGIVWTAEELRSRFGMNDKQVGLYQQVRAAIDRSLDDTATTQMIRHAGEDANPVRDQMLAAADARAAAIVLRNHLIEQVKLLENDNRNSGRLETAQQVMAIADQIDKLKSKGYAPLSRFGRYTVYKDGENPVFLMFETQREANRAARMMKEKGDKGIKQGTMSQEQFKLFKGMTPETLELFGEMLGLDKTGSEQDDLVYQSFLKAAKSNRSALKRLIHRQGIEGYSEDVSRVLASFLYSNARLAATNLHAPETQRAISDIPKEQGDLKDTAIKLNEYIVNPDDAGAFLSSFNFAQYLGGSIASALVNMTQPLTMSFPWLSQYGGAWNAAKALGEAVKLVGKGGDTGNHLLDEALKRADADGHTQPQEVHQLQALASGKGALRTGDGTKAGDALAKAQNAKSRLSVLWGVPFSLAEQFNRRSTFIAAWNIAKDQGMADPYGFAVDAVKTTQGIYNKANRPAWSRNAIGGMAFTFKTYSINYVEMLHRMWTQGGKEGKQGVMLAMGVLFLLSGAGGLPGSDDLDDLLDGVMQRMGYNFSTKQEREAFFASLFGETGAKFMEHGLSAVPGMPIDVSGRMGMGNLIPSTGLFVRKDDHTRDVAEIAGPTGDFLKRSFESAGELAEGNLGASMLAIAPRAVANAWKGVEMAQTGEYRDTRGRKVLDTTLGEAAAKAIGFQPATVAKVQQSSGKAIELLANYKLVSDDIADRWAKGIHDQDPGEVLLAQKDLEDWNAKNPEMPIRISRNSLRSRVRNLMMDRRERLAKTTPKAVRSQIEAMLGRERVNTEEDD